jgi:hypothetical protein
MTNLDWSGVGCNSVNLASNGGKTNPIIKTFHNQIWYAISDHSKKKSNNETLIDNQWKSLSNLQLSVKARIINH